MSESMLWVLGTALIAGVFGFAAVILWLLERAASVPPYRRRTDEGEGSATDAAIIVGGGLVLASALLDPGAAPWLAALALALIALGAVPFQRSPVRRQVLRVLALVLAASVHGIFYLTER